MKSFLLQKTPLNNDNAELVVSLYSMSNICDIDHYVFFLTHGPIDEISDVMFSYRKYI